MVSFSCEGCGDVLTKKKLDPHRNQCRGASFSCLDCMTHFQGTDYRSHTSCISEAQKYQGALYKPEKEKKARSTPSTPKSAYVEDETEEHGHNSHIVIVEPPMPPAPSPPSAIPQAQRESSEVVNVFDFLVHSETPNASRTELAAPASMSMIEDSRGHGGVSEPVSQDVMSVRFDGAGQSIQRFSDLVEYGSGPVPNGKYQTPASRHERERERKPKKERKDREGREVKKDKKRKRLHIETTHDEIMTDAPPILHSGLSGGLRGLLARPAVFPPSPDYSGGDAGDNDPDTPGSPLKKPKHSRRGRVGTVSNNLVSLIAPSGVSTLQSCDPSSETRRRKRKHRRHDRSTSARPSHTNQLMHYAPRTSELGERDAEGDAQMVLYRPRAEMLLGFVNKGPDSQRGVSMNKALKRYHRERFAMGLSLGKGEEEKELWKGLRMRRNERGEVVLFVE